MNKILKGATIPLILLGIPWQEPERQESSEPAWVSEVRDFNEQAVVPPGALEEIWDTLPIQSIRLVRSGPEGESEGFYPEYEITITCASEQSAETLGSYSLGPMAYLGKSDVQMIGEFGSALTIGDFTRLALLSYDFEIFLGMKDYPKELSSDPHTLLEITMKDGKVHRMSEWGWRAPVGVWAFCCVIDKIWADRVNEAG